MSELWVGGGGATIRLAHSLLRPFSVLPKVVAVLHIQRFVRIPVSITHVYCTGFSCVCVCEWGVG